jgi:Ca-activated chloride channel family protein
VLNPFKSFLFILAFAVFSFGQTAPAATPSPKPTEVPIEDDEPIRISSKLVVVPVSVTDAQGQPVTGLKITDFRLLEENKLQQLDQISAADDVPLEIAVLIDVSGSTDPMYKFEQQTAAQFLQDVMRSKDRASVITIGESPYLALPLDTSDKASARIISLVSTKGYTAFFDTVSYAANYLQKTATPGSRKVIIVISDGEDNFSSVFKAAERTATQQLTAKNLSVKQYNKLLVTERDAAQVKAVSRVLKDLQNTDAVFYSVNPAGNSYQLNVISQRGQETMQKFAMETGGTAFLPKKAEDLSPIFRHISSELRAQYLLQYYTDTDNPLGKYVNLEVTVPGRPQVRVRARQGYFVK